MGITEFLTIYTITKIFNIFNNIFKSTHIKIYTTDLGLEISKPSHCVDS